MGGMNIQHASHADQRPTPAHTDEERRLLSFIIEARNSSLAEAIAADLENCALDTPCVDGCPYGIDQDTPHAEDCPQEITVGLLLALARAIGGGK